MKIEFSDKGCGAPSLQSEVDDRPSALSQFLVPLMTPGQKREYLILVGLWVAALLAFWSWWLQPQHFSGWFGFVLTTVLLAWITFFPLYFILIVIRSRVPAPSLPVPAGYHVAMVVTKVPSEPFALVRQTLEAMLRQRYPHDTWLADEDPSEETIEWCRQNGVRISTRKGCAAYHRDSWPRRTRCKEGNLAYFYDNYGYANYDFVVQLDADHVPSDGYLEEMLRPFADPTVGYVSAPSICDRNALQSWSARGRLYAEGALHGALQAGYTGGLAPLCFGSHYAVRTAALKQIGGLGPELAEDHSTTLMMNAHGWRGVHAVNAIARGDGPNSFADMVTQEFQWSRSLMTILLQYTPKYYPQLPARLKFQFVFSQLWYASDSLMMLVMFLLPLLALTLDEPLVNAPYPYFLAHLLPLMIILVAMVWRLRSFGVLRPHGAKIVSWEGFLFLFARWPWTLLGTITAVGDRMTGRVSKFRVTPKGFGGVDLLPLRVVAPYVIISIVSGLTVTLLESREAAGYYIFALINCVIYNLLLVVVLLRHERGNKPIRTGPCSGLPARCSTIVLIGAAILIPIFGTERVPAGLQGILWTEGASTDSGVASPALAATAGGPIEGFSQKPMFGIYDPSDLISEMSGFGLEHIYVQWNALDQSKIADALRRAKSRHRILMVTVEPFTHALNWHDGGDELFSNIVSGDYDTSIDEICGLLAQTGPVLIRWGHEMEDLSGRYPWARNDPGAYIEAYRHFVRECRSKAPNGKYVWSPKGYPSAERYYPGDAYVDFVGFSAYAFETWDLEHLGRASVPDEVIGSRYGWVSQFRKRVIIAELGVAGSSGYVRRWLLKMNREARRLPLLTAIVYFNDREPYTWGSKYGSPDWRVPRNMMGALTQGARPTNRE